jgi:hypothetical protein
MPPGTPTGTRATVARGSPPNPATTSTPRASADGPLDDRGLEASPHAQRVERSAQCPRRVAVGGLQRGDAAEHVAAARPAGCPPRTVLENGGAPMEERSDDGAGLRTTSSDRPCRPKTSRRSGRPKHRSAHPAPPAAARAEVDAVGELGAGGGGGRDADDEPPLRLEVDEARLRREHADVSGLRASDRARGDRVSVGRTREWRLRPSITLTRPE